MITANPKSIPSFLDEHFLLNTESARRLYHEYAKDMPIIDYHCHLPPDEIAADKRFSNLTQVWLNGDHYKWRAMRTNGVNERFITGDAGDYEKFEQWANTVPFTLRNPLYHWTHLELRRYFGIQEILSPATAQTVYQEASTLLNSPEYSVRNLLRKMNVATVCTTDDPVDSLEYHQNIKADGFEIPILPAFRPDKAILIEKPSWPAYIRQLAEAAGMEIATFQDLLDALQNRIAFFHDMGSRLSDHGLEQIYAAPFTEVGTDRIFRKRLGGQTLEAAEAEEFMSALLYHLGVMYHAKGWTQQFHLGALRNNNSRMMRTLGPDTGFDSIGDWSQAAALARFMDRLDNEDKLTKTIVYNLNPRDNELMATMIGNFNDGSIPGKIQYGSAWWFLDQKDGMEKQINALSNMGLLSRFVGMLTDSRSFMSYPRHEYFRRILCQILGREIENGELPNDIPWIGKIVQDVCFRNAKAYFGFEG
ncbi:MAG: glucuronate isomerase [Haliscomenobacter sp.]|nr:glucuronate isomerase [Haliscomenobacter sp.]